MKVKTREGHRQNKDLKRREEEILFKRDYFSMILKMFHHLHKWRLQRDEGKEDRK